MGLTPPSRLGAPKELLPKASKHVVNIWVPTIVPSSIHRCDFITSPRHMGPDTHIKRRSTKHSRKPHSLSYEAVGSSSCLPPRGGGPFCHHPQRGDCKSAQSLMAVVPCIRQDVAGIWCSVHLSDRTAQMFHHGLPARNRNLVGIRHFHRGERMSQSGHE